VREFELALLRRDDVIRTLSANLRTMTENRDSLQTEYMTQASQLVEQVQLLQDQLKQVSLPDYMDTSTDQRHLAFLSQLNLVGCRFLMTAVCVSVVC